YYMSLGELISLPQDLLVGDGLARTLATASVAPGALAANGQTAPVAQAAIAVDFLQSADVLHDQPAQGPLDRVGLLEMAGEIRNLVVLEVLGPGCRVDAEVLQNLLRSGRTHPINVGERHFDALFVRDIYAEETGHAELPCLLTLTLLVPGIRADDAHD